MFNEKEYLFLHNNKFTIKEYHSEKDSQTGRNVKVELRPLNNQYPIIEIKEEDQVDIVAVLKEVFGWD